jgi:hypothetical protein
VDERREPRVSLSGRVVVVPCPEGLESAHASPLSVPMRDLSRGGVRFLLPRRLPLDTQFILLLSRETGTQAHPPAQKPGTSAPPPALALECTVIYWQPLARDLFAIGGQFVRVLSATDYRVPDEPPRVVLPGLAAGDPGADPAQVLLGKPMRRAAS